MITTSYGYLRSNYGITTILTTIIIAGQDTYNVRIIDYVDGFDPQGHPPLM
jgi:hypothetical protein